VPPSRRPTLAATTLPKASPPMHNDSTSDTINVVTPNCAMPRRSQTTW